MKSRICLIRHGITEGNKKKLYYGHSDIDLAEEGITELKELVSSGLYPDGEAVAQESGAGPGAAQRREHPDILWQDKKRLRGAEEEACSEGIVHETFRQGGPEHSHMPWRNNFGSDGGGLSGEKG